MFQARVIYLLLSGRRSPAIRAVVAHMVAPRAPKASDLRIVRFLLRKAFPALAAEVAPEGDTAAFLDRLDETYGLLDVPTTEATPLEKLQCFAEYYGLVVDGDTLRLLRSGHVLAILSHSAEWLVAMEGTATAPLDGAVDSADFLAIRELVAGVLVVVALRRDPSRKEARAVLKNVMTPLPHEKLPGGRGRPPLPPEQRKPPKKRTGGKPRLATPAEVEEARALIDPLRRSLVGKVSAQVGPDGASVHSVAKYLGIRPGALAAVYSGTRADSSPEATLRKLREAKEKK